MTLVTRATRPRTDFLIALTDCGFSDTIATCAPAGSLNRDNALIGSPFIVNIVSTTVPPGLAETADALACALSAICFAS